MKWLGYWFDVLGVITRLTECDYTEARLDVTELEAASTYDIRSAGQQS